MTPTKAGTWDAHAYAALGWSYSKANDKYSRLRGLTFVIIQLKPDGEVKLTRKVAKAVRCLGDPAEADYHRVAIVDDARYELRNFHPYSEGHSHPDEMPATFVDAHLPWIYAWEEDIAVATKALRETYIKRGTGVLQELNKTRKGLQDAMNQHQKKLTETV